MKTLIIRLGLGATAVLLGIGAVGCASHNTVAAAGPARTIPQLGAEMQKNGIMSQSDYARQNALAQAVIKTHTISDADLTWTLAQLAEEKNALARARAFNILADIRPMSAAQKSRILPAIALYLASSDRLDQIGAQLVQKSAQASQ